MASTWRAGRTGRYGILRGGNLAQGLPRLFKLNSTEILEALQLLDLLVDPTLDWRYQLLIFAVLAMVIIVVLLVLVFASQQLRMPAADGQVYRKGGS